MYNLPFFAGADARDHRDVAGLAQRLDHAGGRRFDRHPDHAEIDRFAAGRLVRRGLFNRRDAGICAGQSDGLATSGVDRGDELGVDRPREHRDDDVQRFGVGDAQAIDLALRDAHLGERGVDLAAAAMHDHHAALSWPRSQLRGPSP